MPTIAPWLLPPNFLGAMSSGAQAGLQLRSQYLQQQAQAAAEAQAAERLRLANEELFQRARQDEMANQLKAEAFAQERQRFDLAQQRQARLEEANKLFGSTLAQGLGGEKPDILGAFAQAAGAAPGAEAVQKLDADALLNAQMRQQNKGYSLARDKILEQKTGIRFLNPDGSRDEDGYLEAIKKSSEMAQQQLTPMAIRTANELIADQEEETGITLTPQQRAATKKVLLSYGNKNPTLETGTRDRLNVAEIGIGGADRVLAFAAKHPDLRFAPGLFTLDVKRGEWVGGPPEASELLQDYNALYTGQAFAKGGKALTPTELQAVRDQIGNPNQVNFIQKLKTFVVNQADELGVTVRQLQDRKFDLFPAYDTWFKRLSSQREDVLKKYGLEASGAFAAPASTNRLSPEQEARRQELLRKAAGK